LFSVYITICRNVSPELNEDLIVLGYGEASFSSYDSFIFQTVVAELVKELQHKFFSN
jgi:hypothetical protein